MLKETINDAAISPQVAAAASDLRVVLGRLIRRLRQPDAADEITLSQVSVLKRLDHDGPMTSGAVAAAERVRPQSMSTTLAALEATGLVARRPDPDDGRHAMMVLTAAGAQALQGVRLIREERLGRAISDHLTAAEQQSLIATLPLLERLVDVL